MYKRKDEDSYKYHLYVQPNSNEFLYQLAQTDAS